MASLKEIRTRLTSVNSTMQITSAMKMVSAAKLKRAQDAITQMRPYAEKLQEILSNVSSSLDSSDGQYSRERDVKRTLVIAITSNRGLCGGFNNNVIKQIRTIRAEQEGEVKVLSLGKKAFDIYQRQDVHTTEGFSDKPFEIWDDLTFENVSDLAEVLMQQFLDGTWDKIIVVYNRFKNAAVQVMMAEQFLPVVPPQSDDDSARAQEYIFEPSKEFIVNEIIPNSLKTQLFKAFLDSQAAEHGARMTAMHTATENAKDLMQDLRLRYNKARQAAITGEILEIVGGAEALNQ